MLPKIQIPAKARLSAIYAIVRVCILDCRKYDYQIARSTWKSGFSDEYDWSPCS